MLIWLSEMDVKQNPLELRKDAADSQRRLVADQATKIQAFDHHDTCLAKINGC